MLELVLRPDQLSAEWERLPNGERAVRLSGLDPRAGIVTHLVIAEAAWDTIVERLGGLRGIQLADATELERLPRNVRTFGDETG